MIHIIFEIVRALLGLVSVVLIIQAVLSWLIAFDLVGPRTGFVPQAYGFLSRLTNPLLRPIRRFIPQVSGVDLSLMVLLFLIFVLIGQGMVLDWLEALLRGGSVL